MATIQGVYVALFGRPADPTGLAYFNGVTQNGANLNAIGDLASTKEYTDRFAGFNNIQIVTAIYQSLFNRAPEAAGLNFFVDALNKGTLNVKNIAIAILDGAQGSDKTILDVKLAAAAEYTKQLDTPTEIGAYVGNAAAANARDWLATITTTAPTAAAVGDQIKTLSVGSTIALAAGDTVLSTSVNTAADKVATNNDDTINAGANLSANDSIDGGLGTDTLNASIAAAVTPASIKSVEKLFITSTNDAAALNLTNATGVSEVWAKGTATTDLSVSNISKGVTLGVEGANGDLTFAFKAAEVTGSADDATLAVKGGAVDSLTLNAVETLNVVSSGTAFTLAAVSASTLKDVKISGEIGGSITFAGASTTLKTVDASAVTGSGVSIDVGGATTGVTVTGSKFAETITLSTEATATDKDVVVYNAANISVANAAQKDTITNFTSGEDKLDLKAFNLTGTKTAVIDFGAAPTENQTFLGSAFGFSGSTLYVDSNNDGKYNAATDFAVDITGGANVVKVTDIITA